MAERPPPAVDTHPAVAMGCFTSSPSWLFFLHRWGAMPWRLLWWSRSRVSMGYHRLLTPRGYKTPTGWMYFLPCAAPWLEGGRFCRSPHRITPTLITSANLTRRKKDLLGARRLDPDRQGYAHNTRCSGALPPISARLSSMSPSPIGTGCRR